MFVLKNKEKEYYKNKGGHRESMEKDIERAGMYLTKHQADSQKDKLNKFRSLGLFEVIEIEIKEK